MPHGDNQDYVERLQQDIRELREEYAAARRRRQEWLARNRDQEERITRNRDQEERLARNRDQEERITRNRDHEERITRNRDQEERLARNRDQEERLARNRDQEERLGRNRDLEDWLTRNRDQEEQGNSTRTNTSSSEGETLVRRSFWSDLANIKVKLSKKSSSSSKCLQEESEARESWYRTSRRYSDSRVRRSMRKKPIRERKSNSWKEAAVKTKPVRKTIKQSHLQQERRVDPGASKDVYKEILDIVNVNNPTTLPFGKDRMAQWVLTSRNRNLNY